MPSVMELITLARLLGVQLILGWLTVPWIVCSSVELSKATINTMFFLTQQAVMGIWKGELNLVPLSWPSETFLFGCQNLE